MFQEIPLFPALTDNMRKEKNDKVKSSIKVVRTEKYNIPHLRSYTDETGEDFKNNLNSKVLRNPLNV